MDAKLLARLRPADDTAAGMRAAMDRVAVEQEATTTRIVALRTERTSALLTGTPKQILDLEGQARECEILLEQLDLLTTELQPKWSAATAAERHVTFLDQATELKALADKALAWCRDDYPRLARAIVEGLHLCRAAENGMNEVRHRYAVASQADAALAGLGDALASLPEPPRVPVAGVGMVPPSKAVQLPAGPDGLPAFWWPAELYGRLRAPGF